MVLNSSSTGKQGSKYFECMYLGQTNRKIMVFQQTNKKSLVTMCEINKRHRKNSRRPVSVIAVHSWIVSRDSVKNIIQSGNTCPTIAFFTRRPIYIHSSCYRTGNFGAKIIQPMNRKVCR